MDGSGTRTVAGFGLAHNENIMGMGERFSGINRRGETVTNFSCDGIGNATTRCYKPVPFFVSSRGYGVFLNTACPFRAWIGSQSHVESCFVIEEEELDLYFFFGPALADVLRQYTGLTGRPPMLPEWTFKYWASRNSFETAEEALAVARRFREEKLDAAVIHLDPPWYQSRLRALLETCADVIKVDFGETSPVAASYHGYPGREMHNLYALLYNKAAFEVTEEVKGKGEALIWARPAYAGSQRYPVHWSGDPDSNWQTLPQVLKAGLSLMLSGFTFWACDIGGYLGTPTPELYMRWTQLGMFCSHVRAHGNTPREPWEYGPEALANFRKYLDLRSRLLPYIRREAEYAAANGLPFIRPLVLDYQDDPTVCHIEDEFLFGRDVLVAPVLEEGARERQVYLPSGEWVDYWTKEPATGPKWLARDCPLDVIPLFVRAAALAAVSGSC